MSAVANETINEVDFCGKVATALKPLFLALRGRSPFFEARIEGVGSTSGKTKRKDLRFYDNQNKILLTGEVKLPGGVSAFDSDLIEDAQQKADHAGVQFFFTWDVNTFVLWDRYQQNKPLLDRRIKVWHLRLNLSSPQEVARPETLEYIERNFLPDVIADVSDILMGVKRDWSLPPDEVFLRSLESHLDWPVSLLRQYLQYNASTDKPFDAKLQDWMTSQGRQFLRNQPEEWRNSVDNTARTLAYIWTNRFIFYKALRARFTQLPKLELGPSIKTAGQAIKRIDELFHKASEESGDYETLLFPEKHDWANDLVFAPDGAVDAWRAFLRGIEAVDFREVPSDIVGLIFQKLISPEERYKLGQHFTGPDPVDLINSFCIRKADAVVLDPACGSGSFLVRAYYRKHAMNDHRPHASLLNELYGADISLYPAHLATLNLAAREINDEANYPRIARSDFFDIAPDVQFCELPLGLHKRHMAVFLPALDSIVGNPPYVRQEKVLKVDKPKLALRVNQAFPGTTLSGRADLHCYFWPHASRFLKENGYFGFLTSGQWLDVDYGFALQRWILENFKIIAILESSTERWFADARVKTCITVLQRCSKYEDRRANTVRFVRFEKPLADIIGVGASSGIGVEAQTAEAIRQNAVDNVRDEIESTKTATHDSRWRILLKAQGDLWDEGVRAGSALHRATSTSESSVETDELDEEYSETLASFDLATGSYVAGKWGKFLRAPDLYFELMSRFKDRFKPLGEMVTIGRGITTGCDAFFMPKDVTAEVLERKPEAKDFKSYTGVNRSLVEDGQLKIIKDGAGTLHPIEAEFIKPEVHSLMMVNRPEIRAKGLDRVVLLISEGSAKPGTHAHKYLRYGEKATYPSKKSKPVPVPFRTSCAARNPWYDLTRLVDPGFAFWPMAQQYRHIIPSNPEHLICNHNLFDLSSEEMTKKQQKVLVAVLNSTLVGLFKTFYGRFAGTEGNLKTEVLDVNLIDIPDPRGVSDAVAKRLIDALSSMSKRDVGRMVDETLMDCHSYERAVELAARPLALSNELRQQDRRELDDAVFEMLGVKSATERRSLVDRLYTETASHFRAIRVTEIQKLVDRAGGEKSRFTASEQAADAWDALDLTDLTPLAEWVRLYVKGRKADEFSIPQERPAYLDVQSMFDRETVYFGKKRQIHAQCPSRGTAKLMYRMAELGVSGTQLLPTEQNAAKETLEALNLRQAEALEKFAALVKSRTSDGETQEEMMSVLERWFVLGR